MHGIFLRISYLIVSVDEINSADDLNALLAVCVSPFG